MTNNYERSKKTFDLHLQNCNKKCLKVAFLYAIITSNIS